MISFIHKGNFGSTEKFLFKLYSQNFFKSLEYYAEKGVKALSSVTPVNTGKTSESWGYQITAEKDSVSIIWTNSNLDENGTPIAILLQYGHATNSGGYVQGRDYINPAIQPIFDEIEKGVWAEITK
jgi:hypothetical protein